MIAYRAMRPNQNIGASLYQADCGGYTECLGLDLKRRLCLSPFHYFLSCPATRAAAIRRLACPSHRAGLRGRGGGAASTSRAALTMRSGSRPTSWFVPSVTVIGRSVLSLSVRRSEEHTSELQSLRHLVCRLLLE